MRHPLVSALSPGAQWVELPAPLVPGAQARAFRRPDGLVAIVDVVTVDGEGEMAHASISLPVGMPSTADVAGLLGWLPPGAWEVIPGRGCVHLWLPTKEVSP